MKLGHDSGLTRPSRRVRRALAALAGLAACATLTVAAAQLTGGCQASPTVVPVRSLQQSGKVSFVCLSPIEPAERPLAECSAQQFTSICQYEYDSDAGAADADVIRDDAGVPQATLFPHLYALVTQTETGEVAVVDTSALSNSVLDENPLEPGANFLHIGAQPKGIVSTPGSVATFVGVAEIGRAGLFAIPSTMIRPAASFGIPDMCIGINDAGDITPPALTSWPACSLPTAPGDMILIDDPASATTMLQRPTCDAAYSVDPSVPVDANPIAYKENASSRAKLVIALPDPPYAGIIVIDAQELLNRPAGSFDPCKVERWVPLKVDLTGLSGQPALPTGPACANALPDTQPFAPPYTSQLGGMSYADGKLYVGDLSAPIIHVVDMHGADGRPTPCNPVEQAPLLPTSAEKPERVVFARKVAAAPQLTPDFKRYLYATDVDDASAMIFDIGPNSTTRRPLQRAHPEWDPFHPRDRVKFSAPPADIIIVQRDVPNIDPVTGLAPGGVLCNPNPNAVACDVESHNCDPGVAYRTSVDYTTGAGPQKLRGEFAFAALTNGRVGVIDIADFDAPCRAPAYGSTLAGCGSDAQLSDSQLHADPPPPVYTTAEASCMVVAPAEPRSANYEAAGSSPGNHVPGILTFPQLFKVDGSVFVPGTGTPAPQMVATLPTTIPSVCNQDCDRLNCGGTCDVVPGCPLQTFVGGSLTPLTTTNDSTANSLAGTFADCVIPSGGTTVVNGVTVSVGGVLKGGSLAANNALVMNLEDTRAHLIDDAWTVTYEGALPGFDQRLAYFSVPPQTTTPTLTDASSRFCDSGVLSRAAMVELLTAQGIAAATIPALADSLADYVQITNALPDPTDPYWTGPSATCDAAASYGTCFDLFGTVLAPTLNTTRDLRILEAYQDHVEVEVRTSADPDQLNLLRCCFPTALTFNVRTGNQWAVVGSQLGFLHHVVADMTTGVCRNSCDGTLQRKNGRLLSSATAPIPDRLPGQLDPSPSFMNPMFRFGIVKNSPACTKKTQATDCMGTASKLCDTDGTCMLDRDDVFRFNTENSFTPLLVPLNTDPTVLVEPVGITYLGATQELAVTDGSFSGLIMVNLATATVSRSFF